MASQVGNQVRKKHQHGIAGKLADAGADDLPFAQQLADQRPAERHLLVGRGAEAAAVFDMLALLLAKARIFMRFAVAAPPHQGKQNADGANADEQHPPAETVHDPEQQRRKAGQPEILPHGVHAVAFARSCCGNQALTTRLLTGKHGASLMPSPKRHSSSVFSPHRHAVEQGKQRPQGQ